MSTYTPFFKGNVSKDALEETVLNAQLPFGVRRTALALAARRESHGSARPDRATSV